MIVNKVTLCVKVDYGLIKLLDNFLSSIDDCDSIKQAVLIDFQLSDNLEYTNVVFNKCKTDWDRNRKDYTVLLLQYNVEDGFLYYAPESSVGHIPLLDVVKFFEIILASYIKKETGRVSFVKVNKLLLDKFFQSIKCSCIDSTIKVAESFSKFVNYSITNVGTSVTSLLVKKKIMENTVSKVISCNTNTPDYFSDNQFDKFFQYFLSYYMKLIEILNKIISSIDLSSITDGLFSSMVLIHRRSSEFFTSRAKELIDTYRGSSLFVHLSHNLIFNPTIRLLFESYINPKNADGVNTGNSAKAYQAASKVYQVVDMMTDYELSIFDVSLLLGINSIEPSLINNFRSNERNKFILMIKDLTSFFKNYAALRDTVNEPSLLQQSLDKLEQDVVSDSNDLVDLSIYQLNDRLLRQLIAVFS